MLLAFAWFVSIWALVLIGVGFAATIPLMHRRDPDPIDSPANYGMPGEAVVFPSRDGVVLGGWWIPAQENARGTIILCPGQNGSLDKDIPQAVPLHHAGFSVLMFDFRAHGRSEGQIVTMGALEQADLFGAVDYVTIKRETARVGVLGFSMGAGVALMVAAQDNRIKTLVVDGAYPRLADLLVNYMRINGIPRPLGKMLAWLVLIVGSLRVQYYLFRANPIDLADRIAAPTLFIHGDNDPFLTPGEIEMLAARIPAQTELWRVEDTGHREAYKTHTDEYNHRVAEWFKLHLE